MAVHFGLNGWPDRAALRSITPALPPVPQIEAKGFLDALVLLGHGMHELGCDDADAVLTLAEAARKRLRSRG